MRTIKTSLLLIIAICTFTVAHGQIRLPPPPPHPPLPRIHLGTPPPPPRPRVNLGTPPPPPGRPGRIVVRGPHRGSRTVVRRHYYYRHGVRHYRTY